MKPIFLTILFTTIFWMAVGGAGFSYAMYKGKIISPVQIAMSEEPQPKESDMDRAYNRAYNLANKEK